MGDEKANVQRLGKKELGRYGDEDRMPLRVATLLAQEDASNEFCGVIPKLAELIQLSQDAEVAYLCTPSVVQISKLDHEGPHFCGYRNMQMLCLALSQYSTPSPSGVGLDQKLTIPLLQDMIERAWDAGINAQGRIETGGIRGTRKHVGTPEAEALLLSLDVSCTGTSFKGKDAWLELLDFVEDYFSHGVSKGDTRQGSQGVLLTTCMPIFLQRPQHSMTIIGLERLRSGKRNLLVFDPAWHPPSTMRGEMREGQRPRWKLLLILSRYRKSERYLKRFHAYETLTVDST